MSEAIRIHIQVRNPSGHQHGIEIVGQLTSDFDEHDTAGVLFSIEFAANNHAFRPPSASSHQLSRSIASHMNGWFMVDRWISVYYIRAPRAIRSSVVL